MTDRYAYLGPEGTFTEAALAAFDPAALDGAIPCPTVQATLDAVRSGEADRAIVPIENSVEGAVNATLDELATGPDIVICAELLLPVTFALLARPGTAPATSRPSAGTRRRRRSAAGGWRSTCPTPSGCPPRPMPRPPGRPLKG